MHIERPGRALWIYLGIGFLLYNFGIKDGAMIIFCILAGMFFYKMLPRY